MKLKDLTEKIGSGATPRGGKNAYLGGDISLIRSQNVLDSEFSDDGLAYINNEQAAKLDNVTVREGDVLLNITGDSIARCCLAPKEILPARVNQHVSIIRPKKGISSEYLMYWLLFMKHHLLNICKIGGTRNALTKEMLEELDIDYPDDAQRIADVLKILDTKIINNKKIIKELEDTARLIYDYWFTQFDFPDENGNPYRSSGGKMVWSDELKQEIPEGWEVVIAGELFDLQKGYSYSSEELVAKSDNPLISLASIDRNRNYRSEELKYLKGEVITQRVVEPGDLLIACTDLTRNADIIGSPVMVPDEFEKYVYSTDLAKIESLSSKVTKEFLYEALRTNWFHVFIKGFTSGTNVIHLDVKGFDWYRIALPPIELQNHFSIMLDSFELRINECRREIVELVSLRDWLLPMLMNGQVKVN